MQTGAVRGTWVSKETAYGNRPIGLATTALVYGVCDRDLVFRVPKNYKAFRKSRTMSLTNSTIGIGAIANTAT